MSSGEGILRRGLMVAGAAVLFAAGVGLSQLVEVELEVRRATPSPSDADSVYVPDYTRDAGPQLLMVYLGDSGCTWSERESLPGAVKTIKRELSRRAQEQGISFKTVGIALDWSTRDGLEHLSEFGPFDEVSAGYNWGNSLVLKYVWSDATSRAATPQVIVYRRSFVAPQDSGDALHYEVRGRRKLAQKVGLSAIAEWAETGVGIGGDPAVRDGPTRQNAGNDSER